MDNENVILPGQLHESTFDQAMRGYHRVQVDEFVTHTRRQIQDLGTRLSRVQAEADQYRSQLDELRTASGGAKPVHAEVSERLSQILRLAAEEADQERAKAEQDIAADRQAADEEAQHVLEQAREEYERLVANARDESDRMLALARNDSERMLTNAHEESKRLATTARQEAEQVLNDAQGRATVINTDSSQRLSMIADRHGDAMSRLTEIRDVIGDLLARDHSSGSLVDAVPKVAAPIVAAEVLGPELVNDPLTGPRPVDPLTDPISAPEAPAASVTTPEPATAAPAAVAVTAPEPAAEPAAAELSPEPVPPAPDAIAAPEGNAADADEATAAAVVEAGRHRAAASREKVVAAAEVPVEEIDLRDPPTAADGIPLPPAESTQTPAAGRSSA